LPHTVVRQHKTLSHYAKSPISENSGKGISLDINISNKRYVKINNQKNVCQTYINKINNP